MQRLFTGLLCFLIFYLLCGCAAFKDGYSRLGQESHQETETKAETKAETESGALIPGMVQTCRLDTVACVPRTTSPVVTPDKAAPVVEIPETSYDFGTMSEDKVYVHKFRIKNAGTSELKIKKILPG